MVYRAPAEAPGGGDLDREARAAALDGDLRAARARTRRLLQAAGLFSGFLYLKIEAFGWIPAGVVHFGSSVWAALWLASAVGVFDQWRTARDLKKAMKPQG